MERNNTDVIIDDKVYTISTDQDPAYVRQLAAYINEKLDMLHRSHEYSKQPYGVRHMLVLMNIADDYYQMKQQAETAQSLYKQQEAEFYNMKREMVNMQLAMERMKQEMQRKQESTPAVCPYLQSLAAKEQSGAEAAAVREEAAAAKEEAACRPEEKRRPPYELFARNGNRK